MKKNELKTKLVSFVFVLLLTMSMFAGVMPTTAQASLTTIYVPDNYTKIQWAVDNATAGDTIFVKSGTYYENVDVNKQLTLKGVNTGTGKPVVDAGGSGSAITLSTDGITLEGFTATNSGSAGGDAGIKVTSSNNTITGNTASNNNYDGIVLRESCNNTITGNTASSNNRYGIILPYHSRNNNITGNTATNNHYAGICLSYSSNNNTITGNNASSNNWHAGIYLSYSSNNAITGNTAHNNDRRDGIFLSNSNNNTLTGNNVSSNSRYGICLGVSSNNTITGNNASNNKDGIGLSYSSNNIIANNGINGSSTAGFSIGENSYYNTIVDNKVNGDYYYHYVNARDLLIEDLILDAPKVSNLGKISLINCTNVTLRNLTLSNNYGYGVYVHKSNDITIENNTANSNNNGGIYLSSSSSNTIINNTANSDNKNGIGLSYSSNNIIANNEINGSSTAGFWIPENSYYNTIVDNKVNGDYYYHYVNARDLLIEDLILDAPKVSNLGKISLINCTNVTLRNLTLSNNYGYGVYVHKSNDITIENNTANSNNNGGIHLSSSSSNTIINNTASNNKNGIDLSYSSNNTITGNIARSNDRDGIDLSYSSNNTITGNIARSNDRDGIYLVVSSNNTITGNNARNNGRDGIDLLSSCNNTITGNTASSNNRVGIILDFHCSNNTITGNTATNNHYAGICLTYSPYNTLTGNNAHSNNRYGIYISYSSYNTITGNNANNNHYYDSKSSDGIFLSCSNNNTLTGNNVSSNSRYGISLGVSSYNILTGNNASNNKDGIGLPYYSHYNIITGNTVSNNDVGICLSDGNNNIIKNTALLSNNYGIYLSGNNNTLTKNTALLSNNYGVYISKNSHYNNINHNNFIENNNGGVQALDNGTDNQWNTTSKGNYWSDYTSRYPFAENDGCVWNTPYDVIGHGGSADYYPLVNQTESEIFAVYKISPTYGPNITVFNVTIYGNGFIQGLSVNLTKESEENIPGKDVVLISKYQIIAKFNLTGKTLGLWNVEVTLPDGEQTCLTEAFEIKGFVYGIFPDYGFNLHEEQLVTVYGFGFTDGVVVKLSKEGKEDIEGENIFVFNKTRLTTKFNLTGRATGLWDVVVTLPGGEQDTLTEAFEIVGGEGYFFQNITIEAGESQEYGIVIPESDNLFITLQKTTLVSYGNSWQGKLSLLHEGEEIASDSGSHDLILHIVDPIPGFYTLEVTADQAGSGILTVLTSLPELPLGEWVVGTIYCSAGSVWYQVEVPPDQDTLYFDAECMGLWSHFDIYYGEYGSSDHWRSPDAYADRRTSIEIPNPAAGTYIVEFWDSAMIYSGGRWSEDQTRDILIKADTTFSVEPPPDYLPMITRISTDRGGNTGFVTIEIMGGWLDPNATVSLVRSGYEDIVAQNVLGDPDGTTLSATFNLADKEPGEWSLVLTNPNGRNATAPTLFVIEEGGNPELWVEIVGREKIRVGREQTYVIRYGNQGSTDAQDIILWITVPVELQYQLNLPLAMPGLDPIERPAIFILLLKVPAGSSEEFTLKLLSSKISEFSLSAGFFISPPDNSEFSLSAEFFTSASDTGLFRTGEIGEGSDGPKPGDVVFRYWGPPPGLDPAHNGIYYEDIFGNSWVIDFRNDNKVHKVPFDEWKTENGLNTYIGHAHPPGWTDTIGKKIAYDANERFLRGETRTYFGLPILPNLDNCNSWVGEVYQNNGLSFLYNAFTAPITLYQKWSGNPGNLKNYIYWLAPNQIDYLLWEQLESFLMAYFDELTSITLQSVSSTTPEDKYGPIGFDLLDTLPEERKRFVPADQNFYYKIDFWNKEQATAPACDVYVKDQLDTNLDWSTFRFEEIGFLNWTVELEPCQYFNVYVDTRPEMDLIVDVEGIFDPETGGINWTFRSLDPDTLETPEDPMAGFLPPITDSGYEIGWVCFSVDPETGLATETQIENQAFVNFDGVGPFNPAPKEGPFVNTIDATPAVSSITEALLDGNEIELNWTGEDEGSGIKDYTIYVSEDDKPYMPWLIHTTDTSAVFTGDFGHDYSFYSCARDNAGNFEAAPDEPDMTIFIPVENQPPVADANGPYVGNEGSPITFDASDSYSTDRSIVLYEWDFDGDGVYDISSTSPTATFTWDDDYTGTVTLRVTDDDGLNDTDTASITVNNVVPTVEAGPDQTAECCVDTVSFDGSFTDPGWLDTHTIEWNFGNGNLATGMLTPTHKYCAVDDYTITLTVTDDDEGVGTDTLVVEVVDTILPEISAEFIPIDVEEDEGLFEIGYSATDICDPDPDTTGVILTPQLIDPEVEFHVEEEIKLEYDLEGNVVEVKGPNPEALWQEIQELGGLRVDDGQQVYMEPVEESEEVEIKYEDGILKIEKYLPTLKVTGEDASGNVGEATDQPVFAP